MTQMHAPEIFQSTIVLSNSRKDLLAAAMNDAHQTMELKAQMPWEPFNETPAQRLANARAERIAWLVS